MRKLTYILALSLLVFPLFSFAANDVTLTTADAQITANGVTVKVSGSHNVDSITVNSGDFQVVMSQSSLIVVSSDKATFTVSPDQYKTSFECKSDESVLTLERNTEGTDTVTVTPSSTTCSASSGSSSGGSSGGGGGGGGGSVPGQTTSVTQPTTSTTDTTDTTTTPTPEVTTPVSSTVSAVFARTLRLGAAGEDVLRLQKLLNSDPDTQIASSGVGSPGNETDYYGGLTEAAVKKFQAKHGVASTGSPDTTGFGLVGPGTRAKLKEIFGEATVVETTTPTPSSAAPSSGASSDPELVQLVELLIALEIIPPDKAEKARSVLQGQQTTAVGDSLVEMKDVSAVFTKGLSLGVSGPDVLRLQKLLNSDPDTQIASSGVGSPGNETDYYGGLTEDAVKRFQAKYGVASSGNAGYGYVGPKTRAKLQEVFGN
jgi:peptidoglycan hydrolase-like protein with peptidoglycan-binding domain